MDASSRCPRLACKTDRLTIRPGHAAQKFERRLPITGSTIRASVSTKQYTRMNDRDPTDRSAGAQPGASDESGIAAVTEHENPIQGGLQWGFSSR